MADALPARCAVTFLDHRPPRQIRTVTGWTQLVQMGGLTALRVDVTVARGIGKHAQLAPGMVYVVNPTMVFGFCWLTPEEVAEEDRVDQLGLAFLREQACSAPCCSPPRAPESPRGAFPSGAVAAFEARVIPPRFDVTTGQLRAAVPLTIESPRTPKE